MTINSNFKVMTIVGTRPEIIRLSCVITELNNNINHVLVHTGQNYDFELNEIFFKDLSLKKPDYILKSKGKNAIQAIGKIIIEVDKILEKEKPNAILILGDTNSCLSVISAKRRKIPIFHMEAGNRCFDDRVPEEINRRIIDHTSDINLTYSSIARQYLIQEGLNPDQIIKIGSPMLEVLKKYSKKIKSSQVLKKLKLSKNKFILVSAHREENIDNDKRFTLFIELLNELAFKYKCPIILSTHPRTRKMIEIKKIKLNKLVRLLKPLSFTDYNKLQIESKIVLSDSGTINEESSILNFPALNIRESFERPEAMEEATVMMVGFNREIIFTAIDLINNDLKIKKSSIKIVSDYNVSNVSKKVLRIILSYTDYVKRNVWKEYY